MINVVDSKPLLQNLDFFPYLKFQMELCHMSMKQ